MSLSLHQPDWAARTVVIQRLRTTIATDVGQAVRRAFQDLHVSSNAFCLIRTFPAGLAVLAAVLASLILPLSDGLAAQGTEEILSYDVVVVVRDGGFLQVTETLEVLALGQEIQRGIFRDFPTGFRRENGLGWIVAPFEVRSVTRDGAREAFHLETVGGPAGRSGVRVRIGSPGVLLPHGPHRYTLVYETSRWVHFGDDKDRIDWNVTGNGWTFGIRSVTAEIRLPGSASQDEVELEAWTGPEGSTAQDAAWSWDPSAGVARFRTTVPMRPGEGLTVRVAFPKGLISPPTEAQKATWFRLDWGGFVDAGIAVGLVLALYLLMWIVVGRDPASGAIVIRYEPPGRFSPAALGYLRERGHKPAQLTAALVSLAVKGAVTLEKDGRKWTIKSTGSFGGVLAPEERRLYNTLLGDGTSLTLSGSSNSHLRGAVQAFRRRLEQGLEKEYFRTNRRWFAAGVALSVLAGLGLLWRSRYAVPPGAWMMGSWLTAWTLGVSTLLYRAGLCWKQALAGDAMSWAGALFLTLFTLPFLAGEIAVGYLLYQRLPRHLLVALMALGFINVVFYHLLERPTLKGRGVLDHLEGFRRFLGATEEDRLDRLQAPDRSLELFEKFLPHAIALGVENRWAEGFESFLRSAESSPSGAMGWYSGRGGSSNLSGITSSFTSSLSSTLSSSSAPPASSGGGRSSRGGGSSGGGGGGGGGGGW